VKQMSCKQCVTGAAGARMAANATMSRLALCNQVPMEIRPIFRGGIRDLRNIRRIPGQIRTGRIERTFVHRQWRVGAKEVHRVVPDSGRCDLMFSCPSIRVCVGLRPRVAHSPGHQSAVTKWLGLLLALMFPGATPTVANAQASYPTRPIRLILPFPPGGAVDHVARVVTAPIVEELGRPFVMENKAGAGGVIATEAAAKAAPDGYTLLLTTPNHTISAALNSKLPYDAEKDLMPVLVVAEVPELLVSHPSAPFETFAGFVEYAKTHPGKLNYSSAGNGTLPHVTMELLLRRTGVNVAHIPYRGAAPAMTDLLAGQVQLKMDTYATASQHVAQGNPDAERADRGGDGVAWIRRHPVDRHHGAGRNAEAGDREARLGVPARGALAGPRRAAQARWC
jgi:hypothetical protein